MEVVKNAHIIEKAYASLDDCLDDEKRMEKKGFKVISVADEFFEYYRKYEKIIKNRYAVAITSLNFYTSEVHIVETYCPIEAIKKALDLSEDMQFNSVDEIKQYAYDGNFLVSEPVLLE